MTDMYSNTSKLHPIKSTSLSAYDCINGSKLAKIPGSVCEGCFARKGFYNMPTVKKALAWRREQWKRPDIVPYMVAKLRKLKEKYFRWFDSGDVQGVTMAVNILEICRQTPEIKHWIPTKEYRIWKETLKHVNLPGNVVLRVSSPMVDQPPLSQWQNTSTVHLRNKNIHGYNCPAESQKGNCQDCRACWERGVKNVSYKKH